MDLKKSSVQMYGCVFPILFLLGFFSLFLSTEQLGRSNFYSGTHREPVITIAHRIGGSCTLNRRGRL